MERVGRDHICCVCWNLVPKLELFMFLAALASAALIYTQKHKERKRRVNLENNVFWPREDEKI